MTIPDSVTSIGSSAFGNCTSLISITVDSGNTYYKSIDGNLYSYDGTELIQYAIGKTASSFTVPNSVETIGNSAFYCCTSLTSITILDSVTSIIDGAFYGCYKLVEVYNLSSLTITTGSKNYGYVGYYAKNVYTSVSGSSQLITQNNYIFYNDGGTYYLIGYTGSNTSITLPTLTINSETISYSIYQYVFYNNTEIKNITIPNGVTSIGDYAFSGCTSLASITISDDVTSIGKYSFYNCSLLTSITIPNSVTSIGSYAFRGCKSLASITIPNGITSIGEYSFYGCSLLAIVTLPNSVTSIGSYAFYKCTSLTSITIPDNVTSIGNYAFNGCTSLTIVTFENTSGWHRTSTEGATSGTDIDVTNASKNAKYLTSTYSSFYWYR